MLFYKVSALVLEGGSPPYWDGALIVVWGITGLVTLAFGAVAFLRIDLWVSLLRLSGWGLAVGPALGVIAYLCGLLARDQWNTLSNVTFRLVFFLLRMVFPDAVCRADARIVGTSSFSVSIAPECSGYEGIGLIFTLLSIFLWAFRRDFRFPRALMVLPLGMILIWLANAFRIAAIVAIGTVGYPELAQGAFHSLAGWVLFIMVGLGLIASVQLSGFFTAASRREHDGGSRPATFDGGYLVPLMAIIATAMVSTSFSPGFDYYYGVRVIAATVAVIYYRKCYNEIRLTCSLEAVLIGVGVFAFWMALEPMAVSDENMSLATILRSLNPSERATWLFFRVAGSVVMVPFAEELAFRGYLTRRLMAADFQSVSPGRMTWWSLLLSSILFGALHGRWFAGTLAGIAYALAYRRRGELADAVVAHAVTNGLIAITVLTTGSWSLWS
jgi:exosortase E/protease (VPEID-CTERM system)